MTRIGSGAGCTTLNWFYFMTTITRITCDLNSLGNREDMSPTFFDRCSLRSIVMRPHLAEYSRPFQLHTTWPNQEKTF